MRSPAPFLPPGLVLWLAWTVRDGGNTGMMAFSLGFPLSWARNGIGGDLRRWDPITGTTLPRAAYVSGAKMELFSRCSGNLIMVGFSIVHEKEMCPLENRQYHTRTLLKC
ncbi:hypothetical protein HOY80DRAFT_280631 [Tuber brumale]|nr:hypothetical protein HOY80DRAFT_280631 [Tuber brumale]